MNKFTRGLVYQHRVYVVILRLTISQQSSKCHIHSIAVTSFCRRSVGRPIILSEADERALASWARWCYACELPRTGSLVRAQAQIIHQHRGISTACKFGRKWYRGFRKRHDIVSRRGHCTKAEPPTVEEHLLWMNYWDKLRHKYSPNDVYNADESGFSQRDQTGKCLAKLHLLSFSKIVLLISICSPNRLVCLSKRQCCTSRCCTGVS